jgi:glycosyltransferase involved in cell wall biosynthesis
MKVLLITQSMDFGGAERNISYFLNNNFEHHEFTLVLLNRKAISFHIPKQVKVVFLNDYSGIVKLWKVLLLVRRKDYDYIFSFLTYPILVSLFVKLIANDKLVINERSNPNLLYADSCVKRLVYIFCQRLLYKQADYITVNSLGALLYYRRFINIKKILYVKNYPGLCSENKNNEASFNFITVGRMDKFKNHAFQIRAFREFSKLGYKLDIFGQGPERENLNNLINSLSLHGIVTLHKPTPDISDHLCNYKLFLFSSKLEGFPNVLSEAYLHQLPIVTTYFENGIDEIFKYKLGYDSKFNFQVYDNGIVVYSELIADYIEAINFALRQYDIFFKLENKYAEESKFVRATINEYNLDSLLKVL